MQDPPLVDESRSLGKPEKAWAAGSGSNAPKHESEDLQEYSYAQATCALLTRENGRGDLFATAIFYFLKGRNKV